MAASASANLTEARPRRPIGVLLFLLGLLFVALLMHVGFGSTRILGPLDVLRELLSGPAAEPSAANDIVWELRLTRGLACLLVGGLLGAVGSAFQALFRNPLAEPYTVGVSSGAAVGGVVAQVAGFGALLGGLGTPVSAFAGGILALLLVFGLSRRRGYVDTTTLLLAGVVVGALLTALLSFILLVAGEDTNRLFRWLLGSTTPMYWNRVLIMGVVLALGLLILVRQSRKLNAMAVGEESARRLGVDTGRVRWIVLTAGSAMTSTAVGMVGIIPFLGLVAPHIARRLLGVDWRWSLVGSAIMGGLLLLLADVLAQRAVSGTELPVGLITALLGAPLLLVLLKRDA